MKFYARDYVRRIYVVQFPMPRFFPGIYARDAHVYARSDFGGFEKSWTEFNFFRGCLRLRNDLPNHTFGFRHMTPLTMWKTILF